MYNHKVTPFSHFTYNKLGKILVLYLVKYDLIINKLITK